MRFRDMRRTRGALLFAQGVHPRMVMDILRHSQISVTMVIYGQVIPTTRKLAAEKLERLFKAPE
jgi:integrase